jgi:hypothetical protein
MPAKMLRHTYRWVGLSTDTKPTPAEIGSTFYEFDTQNLFHTPDGTHWVIKTPASAWCVTRAININQAAAAYTLFTSTTQNNFIDFLGVYVPVDVSTRETFTGISVQSTDGTPVVFISSTAGAKANLTAGAILTYRGPAIVASTRHIQLSVIGGATGVACACQVFVSYRPVVAGGYLLVAA